jgi:GNAT superfamily N-acetyltransferase
MITLVPADLRNPASAAAIAAIWGDACGPALAIDPAMVAFNTAPAPAIAQAGQLALLGGAAVGFALASRATGALNAVGGWVDAIAVRPAARRAGAGSALLAWAEGWLGASGCARAQLGGSLRPFSPGLPDQLGSAAFFARCGYRADADQWDVARDLGDYTTPPQVRLGDARVAPMAPNESPELLAFLKLAFPGRWDWEAADFLHAGGRPADFLLLRAGGRVAGFCQLTRADSLRPLGRFHHGDLPPPWGQLGPIGVDAELRGRGLGAALLDAGLRHLRDTGVRGCVIDWTDLLDFYARFGFRPHRRYTMLAKALA